MRRKLFKISISVLVAIVVFFTQPLTAMAASVSASATNFGIVDYSLSWTYGSPEVHYYESASNSNKTGVGYIDYPVTYIQSITLAGNYTYYGRVSRSITATLPSQAQLVSYSYIGLGDVLTSGDLAGASSAVSANTGGENTIKHYIDLQFNAFYVPVQTIYRFSTTVHYIISFNCTSSHSPTVLLTALNNITATSEFVTGGFSRQYLDKTDIGQVAEGIETVITDSNSENTQLQMEQRESIAAAQASQSAQQHDELVNGYSNSDYDSKVTQVDQNINYYIRDEEELLQPAFDNINDYSSDSFNTNTFLSYVSTITLVSSWFSLLWNGFGQLSTVFVTVLTLGVAVAFIGLKRKGG